MPRSRRILAHSHAKRCASDDSAQDRRRASRAVRAAARELRGDSARDRRRRASAAPAFSCAHIAGVELEAQEVHGGGLRRRSRAPGLRRRSPHTRSSPPTCTQQRSSTPFSCASAHAALVGVRDTRASSSPSSCAVRDQRVVGVELLLDAPRLRRCARRAASPGPGTASSAVLERPASRSGPSATLRLRLCSSTRARNSRARSCEYCSRRHQVVAACELCMVASGVRSRRPAQQLQRMRRLARRLRDRPAIWCAAIGQSLRMKSAPPSSTLAHDRAADLHRHVAVLASSRRRCRRGPSSARSARPACPARASSTSRVFSPMFCTRRWHGT